MGEEEWTEQVSNLAVTEASRKKDFKKEEINNDNTATNLRKK